MTVQKRDLYLSSNGDTWYLAREDDGKVCVVHEPNQSSGGRPTQFSVGEFLMRGNHGPQHQALLDLIGGLVDRAD